jgi:methyl coenzyme M reductase subunit D
VKTFDKRLKIAEAARKALSVDRRAVIQGQRMLHVARYALARKRKVADAERKALAKESEKQQTKLPGS